MYAPWKIEEFILFDSRFKTLRDDREANDGNPLNELELRCKTCNLLNLSKPRKPA